MLSYINNKIDNYTKSGYFLKLFNHLLNYRSNQLVIYLFNNRKESIYKMIDNISIKSIAECILKLLIIYVQKLNEELKLEIMNYILTINYQDDFIIDQIQNISDIFKELILNRRIYYLILDNENLLHNICKFVFFNIKNGSSYEILIKLIDNMLKDIHTNKYLSNNLMINNNEVSQRSNSSDCIDKIIDNFKFLFHYTIQSLRIYDLKFTKINIVFTQEVEYIDKLIEFINADNFNYYNLHNYNFIEILIQSNILSRYFDYFFKNEWNNIYHIRFLSLISNIFSRNLSKSLVYHVIVELELINNIEKNIFEMNLIDGKSLIFKGNFTCLIEISTIIMNSTYELIHLAGDSKNLTLVNEFKYIYFIYIEPMRIKYLQKLDCGYQDCVNFTDYKYGKSSNTIEKEKRVNILSLKNFHNECK